MCRDITTRGQGKDSTALTTYETYRALPSPQQPYGDYDYAIVAEVIRGAEAAVARAHKKGQGTGAMCMRHACSTSIIRMATRMQGCTAVLRSMRFPTSCDACYPKAIVGGRQSHKAHACFKAKRQHVHTRMLAPRRLGVGLSGGGGVGAQLSPSGKARARHHHAHAAHAPQDRGL